MPLLNIVFRVYSLPQSNPYILFVVKECGGYESNQKTEDKVAKSEAYLRTDG